MAVSTVSRVFLRTSRKSRLFDTALGGRHTQIKERRKYRKYYYMFTKYYTGVLPLEIDNKKKSLAESLATKASDKLESIDIFSILKL